MAEVCLHLHKCAHFSKAYTIESERLLPQVSRCFREEFMKKLQAAVKKELNAFERNTRIQTMALADTTDAAVAGPAAAEGGKKKKSNKDDDDENAEENAEFDEGKLRFAGTFQPSRVHLVYFKFNTPCNNCLVNKSPYND